MSRADDARAVLRELAGVDAAGVWAAPGRVNVIGEHTDYNDGFVLPIAIDRSAVVAAAARADDELRCWSVQRGAAPVVSVGNLVPEVSAGWWAYVHGVAWALREAGVPVGGADLVVDSDVPLGAGLSSSAALESAAAVALCAVADVDVPAADVARAGQRAEWEWAGTPCGIMDQTASVSARAGHALLLDTRSMRTEHVPLSLADGDLALLVINTNVAHQLRDGGYAARRRECELAAEVLGVAALRDATEDDVAAAADRIGAVGVRRARHVVTENARVLAVVDLLREDRLDEIGPHLLASHASLRDDFDVSIAELDTAVDAAIAAGALGARMTGGGFGGSAIALVPRPSAESVEAEVRAAFASSGFAAPDIFPVTPADGARRIG